MSHVSSLHTEHTFRGVVQHQFIWTDEHLDELRIGLIKTAIDEVRDGRKSKRMQQEAREWIMTDDLRHPLSYLNCCRAIGLDGEKLRELLNHLLKGGLYEPK